MAPLLPKLRGHFAEFLNKGYPARLRIFSSPTCVGLRYGHLEPYLATFLASVNSSASLLVFTPLQHPASLRAYFTTRKPHALLAPVHQCDQTILLCHCLIFPILGGTGISTCCPSSTPFGLDLGPDLPWVDEPSPGNLWLSTAKFLASLSLLMPAFSLVYSPLPLSIQLLPVYIAPLPIRCAYPQTSVTDFSPGNLRRSTTRPVSYYALFECVAASKPTSWLF